VFGPEELYERDGDVKDVVFPCGQTIDADGGHRSSVLRSSRLLYSYGHRQHPLSALLAGRKFESSRNKLFIAYTIESAKGTHP